MYDTKTLCALREDVNEHICNRLDKLPEDYERDRVTLYYVALNGFWDAVKAERPREEVFRNVDRAFDAGLARIRRESIHNEKSPVA